MSIFVELVLLLHEIRTAGVAVLECWRGYGDAYLVAHKSVDSVCSVNRHMRHDTCTPSTNFRRFHMLEIQSFTCFFEPLSLHSRRRRVWYTCDLPGRLQEFG